ncbi:MAG TPA: hypothetical protein VHG29_10485 [Novosphingobium sp.]|nr:hypothetical protein [Novosphingobium sp.]
MSSTLIAPPPSTSALPVPHTAVRQSVAQMLTQSPAFQAMPLSAQQDIARNTALVADYIARPEGIEGTRLKSPSSLAQALGPFDAATDDHSGKEATWDQKQAAVDAIGKSKFTADAAREGAKVAGELLEAVKFPTFVSALIHGVFQSITDSSIQQMKAYQEMIASVATSLHQFMDDHVDPNQGRDHMVDQFPDLFEIGMDDFDDNPKPKLQLREGVDEGEALKKVNNKLEFENGALKSLDLSDENVEKALVENSRMQLARQRQQLMASIVLMGINRIVVTDGKISAKIIYDVKATDNLKKRRSATAMDVARNQDGTVQTTSSGTGEYDSGSKREGSYQKDEGSDYSADYYSKGKYQYENKPVITASTAASETSESAIQTKIQLSGIVDVNFKSDYLPLDKMATPGMIAAIQGNSSPVDPNVVPSPRAAPAAAANTSAPIAALPAAAPAAAPAG